MFDDPIKPTVADPADPVAGGKHLVIVGGANDGDSLLRIEFLDEFDDLPSGLCVEIPSRFVGQDNGGRIGQGSRHRHPLLLTA
jgi:hypothetical protein